MLVHKCTSTPGGKDSAPDQELLIYHLSGLPHIHRNLPTPVRIFFSDGFSAVQEWHKCRNIQEESVGRVAVSQYRVAP